jgi:hypothetical protein
MAFITVTTMKTSNLSKDGFTAQQVMQQNSEKKQHLTGLFPVKKSNT